MPLNGDILVIVASASLFLAVLLATAWGWDWLEVFTRGQLEALLPEWRTLGYDDASLLSLQRRLALGMLVAVAGFWLVLGWPAVGFFVAGLIYLAPGFVIRRLVRRRRTQLNDQMVAACAGLGNTARAGLSLAQGLESVSRESPEPLATELRRLVGEYQRGRTLPEAIEDTKVRLRLESFTLFASAILVCLERGGKITDALDRIARSLQENQRLRRKLEADTASGRKVVMILGAFPFGFLGLFYLFDPDGTGLVFQTIIGQVVLAVVALLDYLSIVWARRIMRLDALSY